MAAAAAAAQAAASADRRSARLIHLILGCLSACEAAVARSSLMRLMAQKARLVGCKVVQLLLTYDYECVKLCDIHRSLNGTLQRRSMLSTAPISRSSSRHQPDVTSRITIAKTQACIAVADRPDTSVLATAHGSVPCIAGEVCWILAAKCSLPQRRPP